MIRLGKETVVLSLLFAGFYEKKTKARIFRGGGNKKLHLFFGFFALKKGKPAPCLPPIPGKHTQKNPFLPRKRRDNASHEGGKRIKLNGRRNACRAFRSDRQKFSEGCLLCVRSRERREYPPPRRAGRRRTSTSYRRARATIFYR